MKKTVKTVISVFLMLSLLAVSATGCFLLEDPDSSETSATTTVQDSPATTQPKDTTSAPSPTEPPAGGWTILGTYWQNSETDEIILLNEDYTAVWANPMGGEAQYGRFEWNVDTNRGRLYIEDWDVMMEMTGRGLRLFNEVRNDNLDQLDKLPDGFRLDGEDPYGPDPTEPGNEMHRDALTDTYWGFMTAYYVFYPGGIVKTGSDMGDGFKEGTYVLGDDGKGVITVDRKDTAFTYKDGKLKINTPWGYHDASPMKKDFFDTYFPDM